MGGDGQSVSERVTTVAAVTLVTSYLAVVGGVLLLTRRVTAPGLGKALLAAVRPRCRRTLGPFAPDEGCGWTARVPAYLCSDEESRSRIRLYEDERELGPGHASHDAIRAEGGGRYSHWGSHVYFSTSDGTSPLTNGRTYAVREERGTGAP